MAYINQRSEIFRIGKSRQMNCQPFAKVFTAGVPNAWSTRERLPSAHRLASFVLIAFLPFIHQI